MLAGSVATPASELLRGLVLVAVSVIFLISFLMLFFGSLPGGKIGVEDFLGEGTGTGRDIGSVGTSRGVGRGAASEVTDAADSGGNMGDCFVAIGRGAGTGVSVLFLLSGGLAGFVSPSAGFSLSVSASGGDSLLRFRAGVLLLLGVFALDFWSSFGGALKRPFIASAA